MAIDSETLGEWLRIDAGDDPATVDLLLCSSIDYIEGLTSKIVSAANYTIEFFDLSCSELPILLEPLNTIVSVLAVLDDGSSVTLDQGTDWLNRARASQPHVTIVGELPESTVSVIVTVNAGYQSPAAVPAALRHAAAVLVAAGYDNRTDLDPKTIMAVRNLCSRWTRVLM